MRLVKRIVAVALVVVLVVVIAGVGLVTWITNRALPQTSGELEVPGLQAPVTVARDANGIAHITADSPHDLFLAQGYVHAQERMWQMEVWRHISAGRLSELFGESQLDTDRFIRTVGWWEAAERDLAAFAPATVAILDAYTAGVNAWLDRNRGLARARLPGDRRRPPSRGRTSTPSRGSRSRPGTSATTSGPRSSATSRTPSSVTPPAPIRSSRPTPRAPR